MPSQRDFLKKLVSHYIMFQNDKPRNKFYEMMFKDNIQNKDCVEIGYGLGILSAMASQHKPKSIVAYEEDAVSYNYSLESVGCISLNNNIKFLNKSIPNLYSYTFNHKWPDVIYHELIGTRLYDEQLHTFLPFSKVRKKLPLILPGIFVTEIHVKENKENFVNTFPHITTDPGVKVNQLWLTKLNKELNNLYRTPNEKKCRIMEVDMTPKVFDAPPVAKLEVDVNKQTITKDGEVEKFDDIFWYKNIKITFDLNVEKDSYIYFRYGIKYNDTTFYLDEGHWGVSKYVFNIRDKSTIEVSQKLYDSELTVQLPGGDQYTV